MSGLVGATPGDERRAQPVRGQDHLEIGRLVAQHHRDTVARLDAEASQAGGGPVGALAQRHTVDMTIAEEDGLAHAVPSPTSRSRAAAASCIRVSIIASMGSTERAKAAAGPQESMPRSTSPSR